jgi:hypothetical protein
MMSGRDVSASVLARVLEQQASEQLPELTLAAFNAKSKKATRNVKLSTAYSRRLLSLRVLSAAAAVIIVCGGMIFTATKYNVADLNSSTIISTNTSAAVTVVTEDAVPDIGASASRIRAAVNGISFTGGDCDCGHENPDSAYLRGDADALAGLQVNDGLSITWHIKAAASGAALYSGEGTAVGAPFANLKKAKKAGRYELSFLLTDKYHNVITLKREFEILN